MEGERMQNGGEEVQEPQAKLQKVLKEIENNHGEHHNIDGVELAVEANAALRVKKLSPHAILPSRGSALAAGYDLSRYYCFCVQNLFKTSSSSSWTFLPDVVFERVNKQLLILSPFFCFFLFRVPCRTSGLNHFEEKSVKKQLLCLAPFFFFFEVSCRGSGLNPFAEKP
jgi:hypothetical protein